MQVDAAVTHLDATLLLDDFLAFQCVAARAEIHGLIHCAVGNRCLAPYVGLVPFSANDPVFWHHHANIDRLWNCWTARHGRDRKPLDDPAWMDDEFFFVDENGELVSMKVAELFDPQGRIDYAYDNEADCFRTPPEADSLMASSDALTELPADDADGDGGCRRQRRRGHRCQTRPSRCPPQRGGRRCAVPRHAADNRRLPPRRC